MPKQIRGVNAPLEAVMRVISFVLGILGGLAGVAIHAIIIARFFAQTDRPTEILVQIVLAAVLGVAAVAVSVVARGSASTLAVFLPLLGVLGFFPRPISWLPAGATLIVAGLVALVALWRHSSGRLPSASHSATSPAGAPLHWSEAARLGLSRAAAPPPRPHESWSPARKAWSGAAIVLALAVVVPLSFWPPGGVAASGEVAAGTSSTAAQAKPTTTTSDPPEGATTTTASTTTTLPEQGRFLTYDSGDYGFTIPYPTTWRYAKYEDLAIRLAGWYERLYAQAFVAASFADRNGPTHDGCYLNFTWVEVYDDEALGDFSYGELEEAFEQQLDNVRQYYGVKLIEPLKQVQLGLARGQTRVWSLSSIGGRTLVVRDCLLSANESAYYLVFGAVEEDWGEYGPLFEEMLQGFSVAALSPVI